MVFQGSGIFILVWMVVYLVHRYPKRVGVRVRVLSQRGHIIWDLGTLVVVYTDKGIKS